MTSRKSERRIAQNDGANTHAIFDTNGCAVRKSSCVRDILTIAVLGLANRQNTQRGAHWVQWSIDHEKRLLR
jgi:hypothetical protein